MSECDVGILDACKALVNRTSRGACKFLAGVLFLWVLTVISYSQTANKEKITTIQQFYALSPNQAQAGLPVQIRAMAICFDAGWNQLYFFEGQDTFYINPNLFATKPVVGQNVQISGITTLTGAEKSFTNLNLQILGAVSMPQARPLQVKNMGNYFGQFVEIKGRVRLVDHGIDRPTMVLRDNGQNCLIYVLGDPPINNAAGFDSMGLLGCNILIRGINASKIANGRMESAILFCPRTNEISILEKATINLKTIPVLSISSLKDQKINPLNEPLVHINGLAAFYQPGVSMAVKDPTGIIRAQIIQKTDIQVDTRVNVYGYLAISTNEVFLRDAFFDTAISMPQDMRDRLRPSSTNVASSGRILTNVMEITRLDLDEARQQIPVRLKGVITYADPEWRNGFIQDASGGIYFDLSQKDIRAGQVVELSGVTGPGGFAPEVLQTALNILGTTNHPLPVKVELPDLAAGLLDAHWIEMNGVVRQVRVELGHVYLTLMTRKGRFKAIIPDFYNKPPPMDLVDAHVSILGACGSEFNVRRQWQGAILNVPNLDYIHVLDPAPKDMAQIKPSPIQSIATFNPDLLAGRRIKISGLVTLKSPAQEFTVQDITGGIRVYSSQTNEVQIGDRVDVLGFPSVGDFSPSLEEAIIRKTGAGLPPTPLKTTAEQILQYGTNDNLVVEMEARLIQNIPRSSNPQLVLQDGPIIFTARLQDPIPGMEIPSMESGSILKVTGVCAIQGNQQQAPKGFHLLLRHPNDIVFLKSPPWWTTRHALILISGLMLAIVAALTWIALLRRRVQIQTTLIHEKLKDEMALEERYRELFENASDILLTLDMRGQCTSINHSGEEFFGLKRQEALGKWIADAISFSDPSLIRDQIKNLILGIGLGRFDVTVLNREGKTAILDVQLRAIQEDSQMVGIQLTARDVTEQKRTQEELLRATHLAGMTEVATGVLHNVGNVLNSVNVSTSILNERLRRSKMSDLRQATNMLRDHSADLTVFLTEDPKGKRLPSYLFNVVEHLVDEQAKMLDETASLSKNVAHIKDIVTMQQSYARVMGVIEILPPATLVEDALQICATEFSSLRLEVIREFHEVPRISVDKHKVLQILINLLSNAKYAMKENSNHSDKRLILGINLNGTDRIRITVKDTGIGISPENLTRIFGFGFTTKIDGHGFGLHLGAIAAKEMGGALTAFSDGIGHGACFTLELPVARN